MKGAKTSSSTKPQSDPRVSGLSPKANPLNSPLTLERMAVRKPLTWSPSPDPTVQEIAAEVGKEVASVAAARVLIVEERGISPGIAIAAVVEVVEEEEEAEEEGVIIVGRKGILRGIVRIMNKSER
ncbi:hypothetical protein Pint_08225 [Pistacia integerrima]|uniref:Uncharacterized protein n=1 Tax=Pistacia integerrima TaxID=434235 RepID=A0ACC0XVF7_9ROSI|nr:hypothetical protein Pint_08225 [Pistacia integerrima]